MRNSVRLFIFISALLLVSGLCIALMIWEPIPGCQMSSDATSGVPPVAATPIGGGTGKIAFISNRDGPYGVYLSDLAGKAHRVRWDTVPQTGFIWFLDGRIIIHSMGFQIMNADGTNMQPFPSLGYDYLPSLSPDGHQTVFNDGKGIVRADINGANEQRLTSHPDDQGPAWSPDGHRIAFTSHRAEYRGLIVMNADGTDERRITGNFSGLGEAAWSPDSQQIAFSRDDQIYVIGADGTNPHALTDSGSNAYDPSWSPDGKWIAFVSVRRSEGIDLVSTDTKRVCRVSDEGESNLFPKWQPAVQPTTTY